MVYHRYRAWIPLQPLEHHFWCQSGDSKRSSSSQSLNNSCFLPCWTSPGQEFLKSYCLAIMAATCWSRRDRIRNENKIWLFTHFCHLLETFFPFFFFFCAGMYWTCNWMRMQLRWSKFYLKFRNRFLFSILHQERTTRWLVMGHWTPVGEGAVPWLADFAIWVSLEERDKITKHEITFAF